MAFLPRDEKRSPRVVAQATLFALVDGVLFYTDPKRNHQKCAVVPEHLRESIMQSVHGAHSQDISLVTGCSRFF